MKIKKDLFILIIIILILAILPIFLKGNPYIMHILITSLIWGSMVVWWDLIMGYAGIFSFGQVGFFVIGAYSSGMLAKILGISPWFAILAGGIVTCVIGMTIAFTCLRLRDVFIGLVTFAFHLMLTPLIKKGEVIGTGGSGILRNIPKLTIGGFTFTVDEKLAWFYLMLIITIIFYFIMYKIIHSNIGLAFVALHDSETFAKSLGINAYKYKIIVFAISSFFTGIIGGFYLQYVDIISTKILDIGTFIMIFVVLIVGGIKKFPGTIMGALIITFLSNALRPLEQYRLMTFGILVVLFVLFKPQGVMGFLDNFISYLGRIVKKKRERVL